jgi:predicted ArsR family transcriptional regulator
MEQQPLAERVAAVTALHDPTRRALLDLVARSDAPVSRDDAAQALGLSRRATAAHLDRLAEDGLLAVEFRRLTGRTGPGAGRPAKLYRRAADEVAVTIPERRYDLAGELLAAAIEEAAHSGEPAHDVLMRLARETGLAIGTAAGTLDKALEDYGFEPRADGDGGVVLGNCPFHRLAQRHTDLVCHLNLELLRGVGEGAHERQTVTLDPSPGRCCVRTHPAGHRTDPAPAEDLT